MEGLDSGDWERQENCATALSDLAYVNANLAAIALGIPQLLRVLSTGSREAREAAAAVLSSLASCRLHYAAEIANSAGVGSLVDLLSNSSEAVQAAAASILQNMVRCHAAKIKAAHGVERLVELLDSPSKKSQESAAAALLSLAADGGAQGREAIAAAPDALQGLVRLLSRGSQAAREAAIRTLYHVASSIAEQMVQNSFISPIIRLLRCRSEAMQVPAALTLGILAETHQDSVAAAPGALKGLVRLISKGSQRAQEAAIRTLYILTDRNAAKVEQAGAIIPVVQLLSCDRDAVQVHAALTLGRLAVSHRDSIVAAGGMKALETLSSRVDAAGKAATDVLNEINKR